MEIMVSKMKREKKKTKQKETTIEAVQNVKVNKIPHTEVKFIKKKK